eukprot:5401875-Prymnesium_polylepis.3
MHAECGDGIDGRGLVDVVAGRPGRARREHAGFGKGGCVHGTFASARCAYGHAGWHSAPSGQTGTYPL